MTSSIGTLHNLELYNKNNELLNPLCKVHEEEAQQALIQTINNLYQKCETFKSFCEAHLKDAEGSSDSIKITRTYVMITSNEGSENKLFFADLATENESDSELLSKESKKLLKKINLIYSDCMSHRNSEKRGSAPLKKEYRQFNRRNLELAPTEIHYHTENNYYGNHDRYSYRHDYPKNKHLRRFSSSDRHKVSSKVAKVQTEIKTPERAKQEVIPKYELLTKSLKELSDYLDKADYLDIASNNNPLTEELNRAHLELGTNSPKKRDQLYNHMYLLFTHKIATEPANEADRWKIGEQLFLNKDYQGIKISHKDRALALRLMVLDGLRKHYIESETPRDALKATYAKLPQKFRHNIEYQAWKIAKGEPNMRKVCKLGKIVMNFETTAGNDWVRHEAINECIKEILAKKNHILRNNCECLSN